MRVLLVNGGEYASTLCALGHEVAIFGYGHCMEGGALVREFTLEAAVTHAGFEPDLVICELFGSRPLLHGLETAPWPLAAYVFDSSFNHFWLRHYLHLFDHVFVDFKNSIPRLAREGISAHWLPYAIGPEDFPEPSARKEYDLAFVGVTEKRLRRQCLIETLRRHFEIRVAGSAPHGEESHKRLTLRQMAEFYARARIVINECLFEGINFRVFEGMASGSLLLTEATDNGLPELFTDGVHLATFTPATLIDRVRYFLTHEAERERIAAAGRRQVLAEHTRAKRVETLLGVVEPSLGRRFPRDAARGRTHAAYAAYHLAERTPHLVAVENSWARQGLRQTLERAPEDGAAHWMLALLETQAGDPIAALHSLSSALPLLPDTFLPLFHTGQLLAQVGEGERAVRAFRAGLERCTDAPPERVAAVAFRLGRHELGAELWLELGRLLESLGLDHEPNASPRSLLPLYANGYYTRALEARAGVESLIALGALYTHAGVPALAYEAFMLALDERPTDPNLLMQAAATALQVFQREFGLELVRRALRLDPAKREDLKDLPLLQEERDLLLRS